MTGKILSYYKYIRPLLAEWAGIPEGNAFVFGEQSLANKVNEAMARLETSIVIRTVSIKSAAGTSKHIRQPIVELVFLVQVASPVLMLEEFGVPVHDISEAIIYNLHAHAPPSGAAGMMIVPEFEEMVTQTEKEVEGEPFFVMNIVFKCNIRLNKPPVTEAD